MNPPRKATTFVLAVALTLAYAARGSNVSFEVGKPKIIELAPGQSYTVNFLTSGAAQVIAEFSTSPGIVAIYAVTHPRSELQEVAGRLKVHCSGLIAEPHRIVHTHEGLPSGTFEFQIRERGHFGLLFHNAQAGTAQVEVVIRVEKGQLAFTAEGPTTGQEPDA